MTREIAVVIAHIRNTAFVRMTENAFVHKIAVVRTLRTAIAHNVISRRSSRLT
jgi:hypothetical protein